MSPSLPFPFADTSFQLDPDLISGIDEDPGKAKGHSKHIFGIQAGSAAALTHVQHIARFYEQVSTKFDVSLLSKCGGCVVVIRNSPENDPVFKFIAAPSAVLPAGAVKAHGFVGVGGIDSLTRNGSSMDLPSWANETYFSGVSYTHAVNRFRLSTWEGSRNLMTQLKKGHPVSKEKLTASIPKTKQGQDEFLVAPVPEPKITGVALQAALPVCFPVMMCGDFAFVGEVPISTAENWTNFKKTLINQGCPKDSVVLKDSFFRLWVDAVVAQPSIYEGEETVRQLATFQNEDAHDAVVQSIWKIFLDNIWIFDEGKRKEAEFLVQYAHSLNCPFKASHLMNEYDTTDMGQVTIDVVWWKDQFRKLPSMAKGVAVQDLGVLSPDSSNKSSQLKRSAQEQAHPVSSKKPRSLSTTLNGLSAVPTVQTPLKSAASYKPQLTALELVCAHIRSLLAYSLRANEDNNACLAHLPSQPWTLHPSTLRADSIMIQGPISQALVERGLKAVGHITTVFEKGAEFKLGDLDTSSFFVKEAFGLFLDGTWETRELKKTVFSGYTPVMCLHLLNYCEKKVENGVSIPLLPATGFKKFDDMVLFLQAVIASLSIFVPTTGSPFPDDNPLIIQKYSWALAKLKASNLGTDWDEDFVNSPAISLQLLILVHDFFANTAFAATEAYDDSNTHIVDMGPYRKCYGVLEANVVYANLHLKRYDIADKFVAGIVSLLARYEEKAATSQFMQTKVVEEVKHFLIKEKEIDERPEPNPARHQAPPRQRFVPNPANRLIKASLGTVVLRGKVDIRELQVKFGPKTPDNYNNRNQPTGGKGRGTSPRKLCIRFLCGEECTLPSHRCGYHLSVSDTSVGGTRNNADSTHYEDFRAWLKRFSNYVEPTEEALRNRIMFPNGRL